MPKALASVSNSDISSSRHLLALNAKPLVPPDVERRHNKLAIDAAPPKRRPAAQMLTNDDPLRLVALVNVSGAVMLRHPVTQRIATARNLVWLSIAEGRHRASSVRRKRNRYPRRTLEHNTPHNVASERQAKKHVACFRYPLVVINSIRDKIAVASF
jgi:hypothetical protein